jgi:tricorn protease
LKASAPNADDYRKIGDYAGLNRWPMWAPDGRGLYFISDRDGVENIWFQALAGEPARKLTSFGEGRLLWPSISHDGGTIVFERDFRIWRFDLRGERVAPLDIRVRPDTKVAPARVQTYRDGVTEMALAPDGKKLAFVVRGEVFADFADKETDKEQRQGPAFRVTNNAFRDSGVTWSPDSRRMVYTSDRHGDEEVYRYDVLAHVETRLTDGAKGAPGPKHAPLYSPDGAWLAYACGNAEIRLLNTATDEDRAFVRADFVYSAHFDWSPDSKWLVFTAQDERSFSNLYVQRIDEQARRQISFLSNFYAGGPIWSPDGRFVIFTTHQYRDEAQIARVDLCPPAPLFREAEFEKLFEAKEPRAESQEPKGASQRSNAEGVERPQERKEAAEDAPTEVTAAEPQAPSSHDQPKPDDAKPQAPSPKPHAAPIEIVFEGIERRIRFLTPTQMDAGAWCISPDSRDLIFSATVAGKANLWTMPLDEPREDQPPRQLTFSPTIKRAAQFAPEGKSFYFIDGSQVVVRKFPNGEQTQIPIIADVTVDFNQEKRQIFDECWRLLRDYFYDPTFRGLDWSAAREQFAPLAAGAQTSDDLRAILNLMVGELRASHLGALPPSGIPGLHGHLGLLFDDAEQAISRRLRVAGIIPDSPAARATFAAGQPTGADSRSIQVGDELLAVNGTVIEPGSNLDLLLQRTAGRRVLLRLSTRDGGTPREVAVRPITGRQYDDLRYRGWVYANEAYVHRVSAGRLGYVHIREMNYESYQQFLADLDAEAHSKEGIVVDARFNGGGHVATFILDVLSRRSVVLRSYRDRPPIDAGHLAGNRVLNKPTVLVINERSASNTEIFAEGYRRLSLGKIVGRPTAGAVIGTSDHRLLDGTAFRLPQIKAATTEGEDLEGTGRMVDVDVPLPMGEAARGRDRQLDAAVQTLLAQIDERA